MREGEPMGTILTIALRNVGRQTRRSLLLGAAVAFAVFIMSLSSGFTAGMDQAVQDTMTMVSGGHVLVTGYLRSPTGRVQTRMTDDGTIAGAIESGAADPVSVSPLVSTQATVVFGSREQQMSLRGIDWSKDRLYGTSLKILSGSLPSFDTPRAIVLGARPAARFGLGLGDSLLARFQTASGQQNVTEFSLAAIYDDSSSSGLPLALVNFTALRQDLNLPEDSLQAYALFLKDASTASATASSLRTALGNSLASRNIPVAPPPGSADSMTSQDSGTRTENFLPARNPGSRLLRVTDIDELSGQAAAVLGTIRWIGAAVFLVMLILSAAGIANTYRMVLLERTREIGTLRCIGFRRRQVFSSFLAEAVLIAMAGALAGLILALPAGWLVGLIPFDTSGELAVALSKGRLLFLPSLTSVFMTVIPVILAAALAAAGPARRAAALVPAEALRSVT